MNKYDYDIYNNRDTNQAINKNNEDYIIVYLPSNGYYYLDNNDNTYKICPEGTIRVEKNECTVGTCT